MMVSCQIETLIQRSTTTSHLLQLHSFALKSSLDHHPNFISHFLLAASSISLQFATSILHDLPVTPPIFSWNTLIRLYTSSPTPIESVKLFSQLQKAVGIKPDKFTYPFVLKACGFCSLIGEGGSLHSLVLKTGFVSDKYVGNTLIRMYGAFNAVGMAKRVFDEMSDRDVVSWSSMIANYVSCRPGGAFQVFQHMMKSNEQPNSVTLVSLLSACSRLVNIDMGESIHSYIIVNQIKIDAALGTALLEMYSKCGHVSKAYRVFNLMSEKNLQSWTVMISGLADHGRGEDAILLFKHMEQTGVTPDSVSFSAILSACSHLGLVDEGRKYFDQMIRIYNIRPTIEHYGCMVDLFGRAGMIEEAYEIIKSMPIKPNSIILRSFMASIRNHGRVYCKDENQWKLLLQMEPELGANYVIAASLSSLSGTWRDAADLRVAMKQKGLKKVTGCSWVDRKGSPAFEIPNALDKVSDE